VYWPEADFDVTQRLVHGLVRDQFPALAEHSITHVGDGFDNSMWRIGDALVARVPRRRAGVALLENEVRWLPELARHLPIPTSVPLFVGHANDVYPNLWVISRWYEGETMDRAELRNPDVTARALGLFLRALHQPAPREAPTNPFRGVPLLARSESFEERLSSLAGLVDESQIRRVWDAAATEEPWSSPPVWLHGDLHPANLIAHNGELSAVVDFGDVCSGDPATDLAGAWMLLPETSVDLLLSTYGGADRRLVTRALGWAVLFGLFFLEIGLGARATYYDVGLATIRRVCESSHST